MNLLLDTHTFLWFINGDSKLANYSKKIIEDNQNQRYLSLASLWEIAIKISIKKVKDHLQSRWLLQNQKNVEGKAFKPRKYR